MKKKIKRYCNKETIFILLGMTTISSFGFLALFAKILGIHLENLYPGKLLAGFIILFIVDFFLLLSMGKGEKRIVIS